MKRKGLTLVEILLSVAIISVSAVIIVKVFVSANTMNERTRDHDTAVFFAVSLMERIHYEDIEFLFGDSEVPEHLDFLEGFEKVPGKERIMRKEIEKGLFASVALEITDSTLSIGVDVHREESIYGLSRTFYRRTR